MLRKSLLFILLLSLFTIHGHAQLTEKYSSSAIRQSLKKLNNLSSVLYIAAHPDDENTRLIAYFANELNARTAYLSLTRGDGGQNLIGTEKGDALGLLRTQELLEARKIDGGEQFFTRAVDFGYSKSPEETFEIWGKEQVLHDVVRVIRQFRPDVIVTRFPPTEYAGHGHHTASAMLAEEAFKAAADPEKFPEQLKEHGLEPWQAKRLYFNASTWWNKDLEEKAKGSDEYITADIGRYNPMLGLSYGEIAAESRSMHKSQGFGSARQRGSQQEYLQYRLGEKASGNIFSGIPTSWSKFGATGKEIEALLTKAYQQYNPEHADATISVLLEVKGKIETLESTYPAGLNTKKKELDELLLRIAGVFYETTSEHPVATPHEQVKLNVQLINRSNVPVTLEKIEISDHSYPYNKDLEDNEWVSIPLEIAIGEAVPYSTPYWLRNAHSGGLFVVNEPKLIGKAEHHDFMVTYVFRIGDEKIKAYKPIQYKWVDREKGELHRPFIVLPKATVNMEDPVYIFSDSQPKSVEVRLKGHAPALNGTLALRSNEGWKISPSSIPFETISKGEEKVFTFSVTPPENAETAELNAIVTINGQTYSYRLDQIEYDHIDLQTTLSPATAKVIRLDIRKKGERIAYVMGAGDDVPVSLEQIGYEVTQIEAGELGSHDLSAYDALIFGVRAFNVHGELTYAKEKIFAYAHEGGNVIVQYNTSRGMEAADFAPYPMQLSRDRVTREDAAVEFLAPEHPVMNSPNQLDKTDFNNWVQERGLYFADQWDQQYTPVLSWHDPGEEDKKGSLLIADHGKGAFIYTGISFFRQLPAGVPGAYRLFANLISYKPRNKEQ